MKKILLFASALAGLFLAASCQQESLEPVGGNTVTYTVQVPGALSTKAIGTDVSKVTQLIYEVYRIDENDVETRLYQKEASLINGKATVELELVNNQDFRVLFWAQVPDNGVYTTTSLKNVTLATGLNANAEDYAAFAGQDEITYGENLAGRKINLVRPVAQLNIATLEESLKLGEDENGANAQTTVTFETTAVTVEGLSTVYNVAEGAAGADEATFTYAAKPVALSETTLNVNGVDYAYVAMNYVGFAQPSGDNVKVTYTIKTGNVGTISNTIENVPVKANYRTNIIGNLITSMSDYTITLDAEWGETEYVGPEFVEQPAYDADTKTWTVTNAKELAWVAASVNGTLGLNTKSAETRKSFKEETIVLANDIDLENKLWTPIGTVLGESRYTYGFAGTFDGNGKTIRNLKVNHADCAGLFGNMCGGTIKNLTIDGFDLNSDHYAGAILGWGETGANPIVIENCKALNGKIKVNVIEIADGKHDLGDKAGAIVGFSHYGIYTGNEAQNVEIVGYRDLGGIVGYGKNTIVKNCKVTEVTLRQDLTIDYKKNEENESTPTTLDDYIGRKGGTCTIEGNEGTVTKNTNVLVEETEEKTATQVFAETLANIVEGDVINVAADVEITLPLGLNAANAETITIVGAGESTVLAGTNNEWNNNALPGNYATGEHLVLKDLTYRTVNNGYSGGFGHAASVTFINCKIIGQMYAHSNAPHYFYDCTIDPLNGYLYTYASDCVFEGCTFEASEGKALQVFGESDVECDVTIKDCTFKAAKQATTWDNKPVTGIDINSANNYRVNVTVTNCTTTGFPKGLNSDSDLYNIKDGGIGKVNLVIDGVYVVRAGYTPVEGYANLYTDKDGVYCIFDKAGLADFHDFLAAHPNKNPYNKTFKLMDDIDAEGYVWNTVNGIPDATNFTGLVLDGNNKTVSNMTVLGEGMLNMASSGSIIKNITMDNVTNNSESHNAAIFWGSVYSSVSFDNVHIKNSAVNGLCNAGAFVGGTYEPNNLVVTFKNCSVENSAVKAIGYEWQDPTGASGFLGKAYSTTKVVFEGTNSIDDATTITNENGLVGGKVYGYTTWYEGGFKGTGFSNDFNAWDGISFVAVTDEESLATVLTGAGAAGAGNTTIIIESDLNMTGKTWNPIKVDGYHGADMVVIDGNGKTITGLTAPLFKGGFAGNSGIVITNLTIADSQIVSTNSNGSGAFIESVDSMDEIILRNCHVRNSTITGSRTGGLIGWTSGYNNTNDGAVKTYVTIEECSVIECTINGTSVGGINGHAGANPWTFTTINKCVVRDCNLNSTDDGDWRVGVVVGTANVGEVTISNITESGNTLTQTGKTAPTGEKRNYYGRFVGGETGKLEIDGVEM